MKKKTMLNESKSINIEIELFDDEIQFLKHYYLPNREVFNITWKTASTGQLLGGSSVVESLVEKGVIVVDNISNSTLTKVGHKILDNFDRDKKITELLNGNTKS